jgi:F-box/leucine-rich repeat protein 2/20
MKTNKKTTMQAPPFSNPLGFLTEEIIFTILDYLNNDPFAKSLFL